MICLGQENVYQMEEEFTKRYGENLGSHLAGVLWETDSAIQADLSSPEDKGNSYNGEINHMLELARYSLAMANELLKEARLRMWNANREDGMRLESALGFAIVNANAATNIVTDICDKKFGIPLNY